MFYLFGGSLTLYLFFIYKSNIIIISFSNVFFHNIVVILLFHIITYIFMYVFTGKIINSINSIQFITSGKKKLEGFEAYAYAGINCRLIVNNAHGFGKVSFN